MPNTRAIGGSSDGSRSYAQWTINAASSDSTYSDSQTYIQPPAYTVVA